MYRVWGLGFRVWGVGIRACRGLEAIRFRGSSRGFRN